MVLKQNGMGTGDFGRRLPTPFSSGTLFFLEFDGKCIMSQVSLERYLEYLLGCLWDTSGILLGYLWDTPGIPLGPIPRPESPARSESTARVPGQSRMDKASESFLTHSDLSHTRPTHLERQYTTHNTHHTHGHTHTHTCAHKTQHTTTPQTTPTHTHTQHQRDILASFVRCHSWLCHLIASWYPPGGRH